MTTKYRGLIALFTHHKVAANLLMVLVIILGLWALEKLNTQFFPNFALDVVNVRTTWSGASSEDVEASITTPLEQELYTLDHLHKISSTSATGVSDITLEFEEGTNISIALDEINQRIARFRQLPSDADNPEVTRVVRYENVASIFISQKGNVDNLREFAYHVRDQLLKKGIAKIDINGLPEEEIAIEVNQDTLQSLDRPLSFIGTAINNASRNIPAGLIGDADVARQLRAVQQQRNVKGFKNIVIASDENGKRITLGDIAQVEQRPRRNQLQLSHLGTPGVELTLRRTENSDALKAAKILEDWLKESRPDFPKGLNVAVYDESWKLINERITVLLVNGASGLLIVVAILFIFLNGRAAFWVTAGIPVSFLATLIAMYLFGGSINMISLFGLIMAVGIIVDDAIVVAEYATTKFNDGESPEDAAEHGARRMLAPVISSSLTTVAAFLPLMLVGGIVGKIMFEIPFVIVCIVTASLLECFFILPAHMRHAFIHTRKNDVSRIRQKLDAGFDHFRQNTFRTLIKTALEYRLITLASAIGLFILAVGLVIGGRIGFTFFPSTESKVLNANVSFTAGTPPQRVHAFLQHMEQALYQTDKSFGGKNVEFDLVKNGISSSSQGTGARQGDQYGSMFVELTSPDKRNFSNANFIKKWKQQIHYPPGIETFTISQRIGGPPGQDIDIRLTGATPEILKQASEDLQQKLKTFAGVSAIEDDLPWGQEQIIYKLTAAGHTLGLTVEEIGRQLRNAFDGQLVQVFQQGRDEIEVRLMLPKSERDRLSDLQQFYVYLPNGNFVPLLSVTTIKAKKGFDALRHSQTQMTVRVSADVDRTKNNANRVLGQLQTNYLPKLTRKYGISYFLEGRASDQKDTMADMKTGSKVALLLIYIILAWVFASYVKPLVVMAAIPFGITGAFFGHYVLGLDLTMLSFFGIVGLSGIVVNDAIILVSVYQELREKGMPVQEAIIESATSRLRAVILTSLTTIGGLTPLLFETSVQAQFLIPMATSIVFGIAFSTVLVLLVIPVLLSYQESIAHFFAKKRQIVQFSSES